jgi:hypothetical protein
VLPCLFCAAEQQHEQDMRERDMRASGLEVVAVSEQERVNMPASQLGFITGMFKIRDAFKSLAAIAPTFGQMALQHLNANVTYYSTLVAQHVTKL